MDFHSDDGVGGGARPVVSSIMERPMPRLFAVQIVLSVGKMPEPCDAIGYTARDNPLRIQLVKFSVFIS